MILSELPGAELILPGLEDLHSGETDTVGRYLLQSHQIAYPQQV